MSEAPVFGLLDVLRSHGNGTLPKEVKIPNDLGEPVFIVRHSGQGGALYQDLQIHKRFHAGEIGEWYAKRFANIVESDEAINDFVKDKDSARLMRDYAQTYLKGHPVVMLFENSRLLRFLTENGVSVTQTLDPPTSLEDSRKLVIQGSLDALAAVKDMPSGVLDGRLGEIYQRRLEPRFCLAYAWPSLVTVAGSMLPDGNGMRTNLFCGLIGSANSGKTATADRVIHLLGAGEPTLLEMKSGSIEQLAKTKLLDANGEARLLYPDELSHLLKKANVPGANFDTVLNSAFYKTKQEMTVAKTGEVNLNCRLSILGGMTEEKFGVLFGEAGATGFYDRFIFGQGPSGYKLQHRPYDREEVERIEPVTVEVDPEVWDVRDEWTKGGLGARVTEIALRVAVICAGVDGRTILRAKDLGPAKALAAYQEQLRITLKPNEGETIRGQLYVKFLAYMKKYAKDGNPHPVTKMFNHTHAYTTDPTSARAVLDEMVRSGEFELIKTPSGIRRNG